MMYLHRFPVAFTLGALIAIAGCARSERSVSTQAGQGPASQLTASGISANDALHRLMDGNARFAADESSHPNLGAERRAALKQGQRPFAVILGCSDSRIPPNLVFDTGLGDLFVIRVAGNVTDDIVIGSIEYAVEHLGANLVMVLGHERCGAVEATLNAIRTDAQTHGHIHSLVEAIEPAIERMPDGPGDDLDDAVRANVRYVVNRLEHCRPILNHAVETGEVIIVGAYYDLETGRVELLDSASH
jgi:carbonic anhydrase